MNLMAAMIASPIVLVLTVAGTWAVLAGLRRRAIFDHPNPRSSHDRPTPRGGGLAVAGVLLPAIAILFWLSGVADRDAWWALLGAAGLALISWIDDLRGLSPWPRLVAQAVFVGAAISALPENAQVFQGLLPSLADRLAAAVLWLWFVNLFNFMDGIDGLTGVETASLGFGLFLLSATAGLDPLTGGLGLPVAAAALGFLVWNWNPARIFLGDVGSVSLGFVIGWLLLRTAIAGHWAPAMILPLYYLADASLTLARRAVRRAPLWRAHREHAYQRAVQAGLSHAAVVRRILAANVVLVALALLAASGWPWPALASAMLVVAVLLAALRRRRETNIA